MQINNTYDIHDVMFEHCQHCKSFQKQWRFTDNSVEPIVEPTVANIYVARFLKSAPTPETWSRRQLEVARTPETYRQVLHSLFTRDQVVESNLEIQYPNSLVAIGDRFAALTNSALQNAKLQQAFSLFQAFILLVYFTVFKAGRLKKLRDTSLKVYGLIGTLVNVGWPVSRATELLFLNPISVSDLYNMSETCFDEITTFLKGNRGYTTYKYEDCMTTHYTLPSLIAYMLSLGGATTHINRICNALDVDVPENLSLVHTVYPAVTLMSCTISTVPKPYSKRRKRNTRTAPETEAIVSTPTAADLRQPANVRTGLSEVDPTQGEVDAFASHYPCNASPHKEPTTQSQQTNQSDQELSTGLRQRHQQREELVPHSPPQPSLHTTHESTHQPTIPLLPSPPPSQTSSPSPSVLWDEIKSAIHGNCCGDHAYFLVLGHALGGCVPDVFKRSLSPQPRWTESGTRQLVTTAEAKLDQQLVAILSDSDRFAQALDGFRNVDSVSENSTISINADLHTKISQLLTKEVKEKWYMKALKWICFIFPRHEVWEDSPSYASVVRSLHPLLESMLRSVGRANMPCSLKGEVSEALLAASKVSSIRSNALSLVAAFLSDGSPLYLQAELAIQRSILARLQGDFEHSDRIIHDFCCGCGSPKPACLPTFYQQRAAGLSPRLNALHGLLHRSHLENLVQCDEYELAKEQMDHWQLTDTASTMEWDVLPSRTITTSKIFRSQGAFKCAQQNLELCVKVLRHGDPTPAQVLCQLADVYNDLGFPDSASELLAPEIEAERKRATKTKAFRRFLVSSVDTSLQRQKYDDARTDIEGLEEIFNNLSCLDVSDQLLHVRTQSAERRTSNSCP
ncbi:hypothetical protein K458DRAFT_381845 [Lentithecium fluviatile CBS 122367]|uniref:Uncharacterized protein n=1 Tax=Lentithecium fluviatile CBS 122367 TaxID=1168545 RepID=A0A6G1JNL2_9PLEO|nr:hypothetical protein K458DRAFT_381845 [Lentithecium fluviatile CBS 122367]